MERVLIAYDELGDNPATVQSDWTITDTRGIDCVHSQCAAVHRE